MHKFISYHIPLFLFVLISFIQSTSCASTFPGYRVLQYDRGETPYGSRRSTLNHVVTLYTPADPSSPPKNDYARRIVMTSLSQLTTTDLESIVERGAAGILIVLQHDEQDGDIQQYHTLEQFLLSRSFENPIYFTFTSPSLDDVRSSLLNTSTTSTDQYQLVYSGGEASVISTITAHNLHGWLHGTSAHGENENAPTIAIVANYDTWGAAPGLAYGVNDNGSGTIALLELSRLFSRLYSEFRTHGHHNLLFILTGAGRLNYGGTKQWLRTIDSRVLENIEFALCIDSIGTGNQLYLHVSRSPKTVEIATLYDRFTEAAKDANISLEVIHRKINISKPLINWHHEQFSRKRIVAATISSRAEPEPGFSGSSIFDRRIDSTILIRNIKLIAEALSKQIYTPYPKTNHDVSSSSSSISHIITHGTRINHKFVDAWIRLISTQTRVTPFVEKKDVVIQEMEKVLNSYTIDAKKTPFPLDSTYKFYKDTTTTTELSLYRVKPFTFDLYLSLGILLYAAILHVGTKLVSGQSLAQAIKL